MSDEEVQNSGSAESATPGRGRMGAIVGLVIALAAGGGTGMTVLGPRVAGGVSSGDSGEHGEASGGGGGHGAEAAGGSFTVESLVLNPAGSKGTRFLMATVVADVVDAATAETLRGREAAVRDRLMELLGSRTVDQLTDMGGRGALKESIREALDSIAGPHTVTRVYLPTFVIQ
jgi:flagellar FliL protein